MMPIGLGVSRSVTECFQSVTDYSQPVTELGTPKNMAVALPGMTLHLIIHILLRVQRPWVWDRD